MSGAAMRLPAQLRPLISLKERGEKNTTPVSQCHRDWGNDPKSQATVAEWLALVCSCIYYITYSTEMQGELPSEQETQAFSCPSSSTRVINI